jgi:hypothetical protein
MSVTLIPSNSANYENQIRSATKGLTEGHKRCSEEWSEIKPVQTRLALKMRGHFTVEDLIVWSR